MFDVIKKLLFSRQLDFEEGKITLLKQPVVLSPLYIHVETLKALRKKYGNVADKIFYTASKKTGIKYIDLLKKRYKMSKIEMIRWATNSITLSGWGIVKIISYDFSKFTTRIRVKNSVFAEMYGKSKTSTDMILQGYFAGGASSVFEKNVDCKEIKCISKGDPFCEFFIK